MGTDGDFITVMLPGQLLRALDRHIHERAPTKSRSDVLNEAFRQWCIEQGYIKPDKN
jgi:metal-responsive CopG/Arc/MetJ family transcriptional regulator